jgi:hypothetical protein
LPVIQRVFPHVQRLSDFRLCLQVRHNRNAPKPSSHYLSWSAVSCRSRQEGAVTSRCQK